MRLALWETSFSRRRALDGLTRDGAGKGRAFARLSCVAAPCDQPDHGDHAHMWAAEHLRAGPPFPFPTLIEALRWLVSLNRDWSKTPSVRSRSNSEKPADPLADLLGRSWDIIDYWWKLYGSDRGIVAHRLAAMFSGYGSHPDVAETLKAMEGDREIHLRCLLPMLLEGVSEGRIQLPGCPEFAELWPQLIPPIAPTANAKTNGRDPWLPARWYAKATKDGLYSDLLKMQRTRDQIEAKKQGKRWLYLLSSVIRQNPQYEAALLKAAGQPTS
jgi:hypothetical protein